MVCPREGRGTTGTGKVQVAPHVSASEIRLVVSPLEADISESESPAASPRSNFELENDHRLPPHPSSRAGPPARAARRRGEAGGSSLRHPTGTDRGCLVEGACHILNVWHPELSMRGRAPVGASRDHRSCELHQVWLRPARSNGPLPPLLRECEVFPEGRPRILARASRGRGRSARTVRLRLPQSRATPWEAVPTRETAQRRSLLRTRPPPSPRSQREASPVPALAPFRVAQRCSSSRRRGGEAERQRLELSRQAGSRI